MGWWVVGWWVVGWWVVGWLGVGGGVRVVGWWVVGWWVGGGWWGGEWFRICSPGTGSSLASDGPFSAGCTTAAALRSFLSAAASQIFSLRSLLLTKKNLPGCLADSRRCQPA